MGHIYYRQEKYGMAEYHFRRALQINERSSVLRCYLGMALHKLKRNKEALDELGQVGGTEVVPERPSSPNQLGCCRMGCCRVCRKDVSA
jgi:Flp pilus assembly protein TadD